MRIVGILCGREHGVYDPPTGCVETLGKGLGGMGLPPVTLVGVCRHPR